MTEMAECMAEIARAVMAHSGDSREVAVRMARRALEMGIPAEQIVDEGLVPAMADVGRRFRDNEIFVPEVLVAARAMHAVLDVVEPILAACGHEPRGRILLGTVQGDIHDIGKNLVAMMLKGAGFDILDLGVNTSFRAFDEAIESYRPHIVGMSALLTTTMTQMATNIEAWDKSGRRRDFRVMVGGAPVTAGWAREIGADAYGEDASSAVEGALQLVDARPA